MCSLMSSSNEQLCLCHVEECIRCKYQWYTCFSGVKYLQGSLHIMVSDMIGDKILIQNKGINVVLLFAEVEVMALPISFSCPSDLSINEPSVFP